MSEQLARLGIQFERITAVDGRTYSFNNNEYDKEMAIKKNGRALIPGELGCALSHKKIYQKILDEKIEYSLILEDDVGLPDDFRKIVQNEIEKNKAKNDWGYLQFNYRYGLEMFRLRINEIVTHKKITTLIKTFILVPILLLEEIRNTFYTKFKTKRNVVSFYRPMYLAGCYILTKSAARKLLSLSNPIIYPADQLQNKARIIAKLKLKFYAPMLVSQKLFTFGSSILSESGDEQKKKFGNIIKG